MVKAAELASDSAFLAGEIGEDITEAVVVDGVDTVEVAEMVVARAVAVAVTVVVAVAVAVAGVTEVLFRWIPLSLGLVVPDIGEKGESFLGSSTSVKGD
jgi:hypothetical protein